MVTTPESAILHGGCPALCPLGSQVMGYYGCHLTGTIPLSILNDEEAMLAYDFNFVYSRVARLSKFNEPAQLGR